MSRLCRAAAIAGDAASTAVLTIEAEREEVATQFDLAGRDPRDVQQIVDQPGDRATCRSMTAVARLPRSPRLIAEQREGVADRRQGIAQLVREHRNEFVLAAIGFGECGVRLPQRLLDAPLVGDVAEHDHGADDPAGRIAERDRAEPAGDPATAGLDDFVDLVLDGFTVQDEHERLAIPPMRSDGRRDGSPRTPRCRWAPL